MIPIDFIREIEEYLSAIGIQVNWSDSKVYTAILQSIQAWTAEQEQEIELKVSQCKTAIGVVFALIVIYCIVVQLVEHFSESPPLYLSEDARPFAIGAAVITVIIIAVIIWDIKEGPYCEYKYVKSENFAELIPMFLE